MLSSDHAVSQHPQAPLPSLYFRLTDGMLSDTASGDTIHLRCESLDCSYRLLGCSTRAQCELPWTSNRAAPGQKADSCRNLTAARQLKHSLAATAYLHLSWRHMQLRASFEPRARLTVRHSADRGGFISQPVDGHSLQSAMPNRAPAPVDINS